eukprot:3814475-Pleurochrysis_carterae.AAC.4
MHVESARGYCSHGADALLEGPAFGPSCCCTWRLQKLGASTLLAARRFISLTSGVKLRQSLRRVLLLLCRSRVRTLANAEDRLGT